MGTSTFKINYIITKIGLLSNAPIKNAVDKNKINFTQRLNVAKGIGIFLVVLGHICWNDQLMKMIFSFHMPLFFIISGILYNPKKYNTYRQFFILNMKGLILPYVTFYVITYLYWLFIEKNIRPGNDRVSSLKPLIGLFYGTDYSNYMQPNGALWFLWSLFVAKNFLYFTAKYIKLNILFISILITSSVLGYSLAFTDAIKLPFSINSAFVAFLFVGIGYLWKLNYFKTITTSPLLKLTTIIISPFISYLAIRYNIFPDMNRSKYGNLIWFVSGGLAGSYITLFCANHLKHLRIMQYFGSNSLIILGLSEPLKRGVIVIFSKATQLSITAVRLSINYSILCTIFTFILAIPIIYVFNNYLYLVIGKPNPKH